MLVYHFTFAKVVLFTFIYLVNMSPLLTEILVIIA